MKYFPILWLGVLLIPSPAFAQSPSTDSQTLQSLLAEVRQLRQELQTATIAAQRAQILVYRVQAQQSIVSRLQERVDVTRSNLVQSQNEQKRLAAALKQDQDSMDHSDNSANRKELEDVIAQIKAGLEAQATFEQEAQAKLIEAQEQLRIEQAKLATLESQLDHLEKTLESFTRQPGGNPH